MKRTWIRILSFGVAALLALQVLPWRPAAAVFPSLSPVLSLLGALAARTATLSMLLGLPILILAWFHSRWFCRWLCPVGLAAETAGRLHPAARRRFARWPNLGRGLLPVLVGGAAAGYPLFIWLDPLSIFNGFFSAWKTPPAWSSFLLAAGLPLVLLFSWIVPQAWCQRVCPLGASQDLLAGLRRQRKPAATPVRPAGPSAPAACTRRDFLGIAAGGAMALGLRRFLRLPSRPVRPPGALPEDRFTGLCARCGACIRACPYGILRPDAGDSGLTGLLAPVADYAKAHCFEYCNECTRVCPTGAIERLDLAAKRNRAMGLAEIDRNRCIAWRDGEYCMVCHEFCPYLAIGTEEHAGVNCPVVLPDMCRGCGACQVNCPAIPDKAIVVHGTLQHAARPLEEAAGPG